MIAFPRLLGSLKASALCVNTQYVLATSIPPLRPFATVRPRLTSHLVSSPPAPLSGLMCGDRYDAGEHGKGIPLFPPDASLTGAEAPASADASPVFMN